MINVRILSFRAQTLVTYQGFDASSAIQKFIAEADGISRVLCDVSYLDLAPTFYTFCVVCAVVFSKNYRLSKHIMTSHFFNKIYLINP